VRAPQVTVLGGSGAWPTATEPCSGFLIEYDGFRLLVDLGYATLPRLLDRIPAERVDAALITHGHPDHCADLSPLLRARLLRLDPPAPLPLHALPGALDAVLALDQIEALTDAYMLREFDAGTEFSVGPFEVGTRLLPHWVPNAGMRITAGDTVLAYTGDGGPGPEVVALARDADLLIAESTFVDRVPRRDAPYLTSARQAGDQAAQAGVESLLLTHLWPGTDPDAVREAAGRGFGGEIDVARTGLRVTM
jgi:ribonuclease BN (tRNA processing enzyme)